MVVAVVVVMVVAVVVVVEVAGRRGRRNEAESGGGREGEQGLAQHGSLLILTGWCFLHPAIRRGRARKGSVRAHRGIVHLTVKNVSSRRELRSSIIHRRLAVFPRGRYKRRILSNQGLTRWRSSAPSRSSSPMRPGAT